jgi:outer membrane protein, heavy metal efflux system
MRMRRKAKLLITTPSLLLAVGCSASGHRSQPFVISRPTAAYAPTADAQQLAGPATAETSPAQLPVQLASAVRVASQIADDLQLPRVLESIPAGATPPSSQTSSSQTSLAISPPATASTNLTPGSMQLAEQVSQAPEVDAGEELLRELTLDFAINATLMNDPVLRAGIEAIRQASADHVTSSLKPNPELEITQTLLPLTRPFIADEREGGPPQFDAYMTYSIDWYLFGKRAAAMQAALRGVQVSRSEYADLVRLRVLETGLAYFDLLEAQALQELAQQDYENLMEVEEITQLAVEQGARPQVELSRIRLDRLISQQGLRDSQRNLTGAGASLQALMGGGPLTQRLQAAGGLQPPPAPEEIDIKQAVALAERNRPDLQALRWRISEARANMEVARREAYPAVATGLGYTRQFQQRAIGFPDANSFGFGVALELPYHDRNQGNRLRASSEWVQSNHELRAGRLEIQAEIIQLLAALEASRTNAAATADEQLRLAEQVRDSIRSAYEAGGRPLIDVLDSQRHYRETYRNYINSRADYWRTVQLFNAAVGTRVL